MAILSPSKLFKISFGVKGWTAICDRNFKQLNAILNISELGNVQITGALQDRDLLIWNSTTQKWVVTHFYDYFATTTTEP